MKIGIMGGSFNPIHVGHAIIASYIMSNCDLDQLWLMVSPQNPFKTDQMMAAEEHRLRMTEMVARRINGVVTSAFEFSLPRPSYTIDTLNALQDRFPDDEFYLVVGADNWVAFDRWRAHDEILTKFHVLIYPRLGYEVEIPEGVRDRVKLVQAPLIEVSSSYIREQLALHHDMAFYMPDDVNDYVTRHRLYLE